MNDDLDDDYFVSLLRDGTAGNGVDAAALRAVLPLEAALSECITTYHRWLFLPDDDIVLIALGAVAANLIAGDALWLLIVGAPGSGKTEAIAPLASLPYVHPAATLTEAGMLSGTPAREKAKGAKGGLLRSVGEFGIILMKDFSGVLSMNRDARQQTLSALREVYDGSWTRHVGSDGGRQLTWTGKAGAIGAVTPSIDRHHAVMGALGERFVLYRIHVDDPKAQSRRRLGNRGHERQMRAELAAAVHAVLERIDIDQPPRALTAAEVDELVDLASFVVHARTAVERDGYDRELVVMPEAEAPGRLVGALGALLAGIEALGSTNDAAWRIVRKVAWDCVPDMRRRLMFALHDAAEYLMIGPLIEATDIPRTTADRVLEDLVLLGVVEREKRGDAANAPWWYSLSQSTLDDWPRNRSPEMFNT